ncbi:hypothetical protein, partial [Nodularia sphaerocarpa]|uniref:hypothetical protein n=1 Tax=Nodularia sphaerocarpa TaxID=137816 RepID=UPI00232DD985
PLPTPPVTERLVLSEVEVSRSNSPLPTYASKYGYATLREQKSKRITIVPSRLGYAIYKFFRL